MTNYLTSNIKELERDTLKNIKLSKSKNTIRAYKSDFVDFDIFCKKNLLKSLPADYKTVSIFITHLFKNQQKLSSIKRKLVSISAIHKIKGFYIDIKNPTIVENFLGIKRQIGVAQKGKRPLTIDNLKKIINSIDSKELCVARKLRDKTILLLGFAGGFRRSELTNLNYDDLDFVNEGIKIKIKKSKTDQFGEGMIKAIPYFNNEEFCPVVNLKQMLKTCEINTGGIFRRISKSGKILSNSLTDQNVALILKKYLTIVGLDNINFSGHSLRSGFATASAESGADERSIMNMTGHKSTEMVRRYIKESNLFKNNPLNKVTF
jgi:site-specific recombinase XerD